jgi:hypothetical protein
LAKNELSLDTSIFMEVREASTSGFHMENAAASSSRPAT